MSRHSPLERQSGTAAERTRGSVGAAIPYGRGVRRLVVVPAEGDASFVEALQRAWDAGDAVLPLDPRLPGPAAEAVRAAARVDEPVEDGDALVVATSGTGGRPK